MTTHKTELSQTSHRALPNGILTAAERNHECNTYCRPEERVHAHVGYATDGMQEEDVREAAAVFGKELVDWRFTSEHPMIGKVLEPSGGICTKGVIAWVKDRG